jgi:uncharacterized protein YdbL (DUF1318 family)
MKNSIFVFSIIFCVQLGCAIVAPEVKLTGEKTIIENQIIGEYKEIEPDAWAVSTMKTYTAKQKTSVVSADPVFMGAMKMRELNEDAVRRFKNDEAAGEASSGYMAYRAQQKYETDKDLKKIIMNVINDENKARKTIFERSIILSGKEKPSDAEIAALAKRFADDERSRAQKNDWIQGNDGQWQRKK